MDREHYLLWSKRLTALVFMTAFTLMVFCSSRAWADRYYAFIKISCDKKAQKIDFDIPQLSGEDPEDLIAEIKSGKREDIHYFSDLAQSRQKIKCDLGAGLKIFFIANQNVDHPRNDSVRMWINGTRTPIWFDTLPLRATIHFSNANDYTVEECSLGLSEGPSCKRKFVVNGRLITDQ